MALTPEQIRITVDYTTNFIQFSWSASALLLVGQGWLIGKMYSQNRVLRLWHGWALFSCLANVVGMVSLLMCLDALSFQAIQENPIFTSSSIVLPKEVSSWTSIVSVGLFVIGFIYWAHIKASPESHGAKS